MAADKDAGREAELPKTEVAEVVSESVEVKEATKMAERLGVPQKRSQRGRGKFVGVTGQAERTGVEDGESAPRAKAAPEVGTSAWADAKVRTRQGSAQPLEVSGDEEEESIEDIAEAAGVEIEGEEEEPAEEPEPEEEEPPAVETSPLSDAQARQLLDELMAAGQAPESAARMAYKRREESRAVSAERERADRAEALLNVALEHMKRGTQPAAPAAPAEPEEAIDPFIDPDKYFGRMLDKALSPLMQQLEAAKNEVVDLRQREMTRGIKGAEDEYEKAHVGFKARVDLYRRTAYNEFLELSGGDEAKAGQWLKNMDTGNFIAAREFNMDPFTWVDRQAKLYLTGRGIQPPNGAQPPAAQPAAPAPVAARKPSPRRDGSIAAARAAQRSPSARSLSDGGAEAPAGELNAATLVARGTTAAELHQLLAEGGVDALVKLVTPLEDQLARERGW